jgi:hypothetical protein
MCRKFIRATPNWHKGHARYDCVFVNVRPELDGMRGLEVTCVFLFFSMTHRTESYPCALVQWFSVVGDEPDDETGLWMVEPETREDGELNLAIIHLDTILWAAHLIPAYRTSDFVNTRLTMHDTLDEFKLFYVNKFVDHHVFEVAA